MQHPRFVLVDSLCPKDSVHLHECGLKFIKTGQPSEHTCTKFEEARRKHVQTDKLVRLKINPAPRFPHMTSISEPEPETTSPPPHPPLEQPQLRLRLRQPLLSYHRQQQLQKLPGLHAKNKGRKEKVRKNRGPHIRRAPLVTAPRVNKNKTHGCSCLTGTH